MQLRPNRAIGNSFLLIVAVVLHASFHVGSGCYDTAAYSAAVMSAKTVFDMAEIAGFHFNLLDIGGGFPGLASATPTFEEVVLYMRVFVSGSKL